MADSSNGPIRSSPLEPGRLPGLTVTARAVGVVLVMATLFMGTSACGSLDLRAFDQDMPKALVEQYRRGGSKKYVDQGLAWLPFLRINVGWAAKTEDGFTARSFSSWGPLGIIQSQRERATWDSEGRILRHAYVRGALWGLLFEEWYGARKENGGWVGAESFKILKGLLGYEIRSEGSVIAYFLYIPIPLRSGRGDDAKAEGPPRAEEDPSPEPGSPEPGAPEQAREAEPPKDK